MDPDIYEYVIDANDVITNVNDSWESFADENGSEGLGKRVVGSWLWQHLAGVEVKHLFRVLLERVRTTGKVVRVPFRCDAPDLRRHMILEVTPLPDDVVRFSSWADEEESRETVHLLEADREWSPDGFLRMCAWCKRIDAGPQVAADLMTEAGKWEEVEDALTELQLFHADPLPRISHGVCSDCKELVLKELDEAG